MLITGPPYRQPARAGGAEAIRSVAISRAANTATMPRFTVVSPHGTKLRTSPLSRRCFDTLTKDVAVVIHLTGRCGDDRAVLEAGCNQGRAYDLEGLGSGRRPCHGLRLPDHGNTGRQNLLGLDAAAAAGGRPWRPDPLHRAADNRRPADLPAPRTAGVRLGNGPRWLPRAGLHGRVLYGCPPITSARNCATPDRRTRPPPSST